MPARLSFTIEIEMEYFNKIMKKKREFWFWIVVIFLLMLMIIKSLIYSNNATGSNIAIMKQNSFYSQIPTITTTTKTKTNISLTTTTTITNVSSTTEIPSMKTSSSSLSFSSSLPPVYPKVDFETCSKIRKNLTLLENYNQTLLLYPQTSTVPWPNITTMGYSGHGFYSGFRNQMMCFTFLIFLVMREGFGQVMLESISIKDTYGSNLRIPFDRLWDIPHWNSYYPQLPRLIHWDPVILDEYDVKKGWYKSSRTKQVDGKQIQEDIYSNADGEILQNLPTRPTPLYKQGHLMAGYIRYASRQRGPFVHNGEDGGRRNPIEILILKEALRPHPALRDLIQEKLAIMVETKAETTTITKDNNMTHNHKDKIEYMALHARVEPDMQKHPVCRDKKVLNLTDIFEMIETKWKDPPAPHLFLPINRQYIELEGDLNHPNVQKIHNKDPSEVNWIAVANLQALNHASQYGLWNGRVKVFEFGAKMLEGTQWEDRPSTTGALLNFFLSIDAKLFIGTEVSSFSHDVVGTRFYRNLMENYKYLPEGLFDWTPEGTIDPPGFGC